MRDISRHCKNYLWFNNTIMGRHRYEQFIEIVAPSRLNFNCSYFIKKRIFFNSNYFACFWITAVISSVTFQNVISQKCRFFLHAASKLAKIKLLLVIIKSFLIIYLALIYLSLHKKNDASTTLANSSLIKKNSVIVLMKQYAMLLF